MVMPSNSAGIGNVFRNAPVAVRVKLASHLVNMFVLSNLLADHKPAELLKAASAGKHKAERVKYASLLLAFHQEKRAFARALAGLAGLAGRGLVGGAKMLGNAVSRGVGGAGRAGRAIGSAAGSAAGSAGRGAMRALPVAIPSAVAGSGVGLAAGHSAGLEAGNAAGYGTGYGVGSSEGGNVAMHNLMRGLYDVSQQGAKSKTDLSNVFGIKKKAADELEMTKQAVLRALAGLAGRGLVGGAKMLGKGLMSGGRAVANAGMAGAKPLARTAVGLGKAVSGGAGGARRSISHLASSNPLLGGKTPIGTAFRHGTFKPYGPGSSGVNMHTASLPRTVGMLSGAGQAAMHAGSTIGRRVLDSAKPGLQQAAQGAGRFVTSHPLNALASGGAATYAGQKAMPHVRAEATAATNKVQAAANKVQAVGSRVNTGIGQAANGIAQGFNTAAGR